MHGGAALCGQAGGGRQKREEVRSLTLNPNPIPSPTLHSWHREGLPMHTRVVHPVIEPSIGHDT